MRLKDLPIGRYEFKEYKGVETFNSLYRKSKKLEQRLQQIKEIIEQQLKIDETQCITRERPLTQNDVRRILQLAIGKRVI